MTGLVLLPLDLIMIDSFKKTLLDYTFGWSDHLNYNCNDRLKITTNIGILLFIFCKDNKDIMKNKISMLIYDCIIQIDWIVSSFVAPNYLNSGWNSY